jgi:acetoin utilization deacetylase AcuC-like enzyme
MTKYFKSLDKKIIYLLEGGYNPELIERLSLKIIKTLEY